MIKTQEKLWFFWAIPVTGQALSILRKTLDDFQPVVEKEVAPERWHLTLLWLGSVPEATLKSWEDQELDWSQSFVPTFRITHVGQGKNRRQLWAYAQPTPALREIRNNLGKQLGVEMKEEEFVPHINLGSLIDSAQRFGPADRPVGTACVFNEVVLYQSLPGQDEPVYKPKIRIALSSG